MNGPEGKSKFSMRSVSADAWRILRKDPKMFACCAILFVAITYGMITWAIYHSYIAIAKINIGYKGIYTPDWLLLTPLLPVAAAIVFVAAAILFQGAAAHATLQVFSNRRASVKEALARFAPESPALLKAAAIAVPLCAALAVAASPSGGVRALMDKPWWTRAMLLPLSVMILGGAAVFHRWFILPSVCVAERLGLAAGLRRSAELSKGHRRALFVLSVWFGVMMTVVWLGGVLWSIVFLVMAIFSREMTPCMCMDDPNTGLNIFIACSLFLVVVTVVNLLLLTHASLLPAVAYYKLRAAKENLTPERLADLLDDGREQKNNEPRSK